MLVTLCVALVVLSQPHFHFNEIRVPLACKLRMGKQDPKS